VGDGLLSGVFLVEQESCGECKVRDRGTRAATDPRMGCNRNKIEANRTLLFYLISE
jgi:hypothetical protein